MGQLVFHFLNVGKGNCTIADFPSGRLTVVDIDDSRSISAVQKAYMEVIEKKAKLTNPIDYIIANFPNREIFRFILTHPDMDHMSGIKGLFGKKAVSNFWDTDNNKKIDPSSWKDSPYDREDWDFYQMIRKREKDPTVLKLYRDANSECCWIQDGIEVLAPTPALVKEAEESEDYDHLSYVLMTKHANKKILLGGDATTEALKDIIGHYGGYLKSDVLLAPNHGSSNHISKEILDVISPRLTVVSVAEGVDYAYDLYSQYGIVLSTKHYGNIWVRIPDSGEIHFLTQFGDYSDSWYKVPERAASLANLLVKS